MAKVAEVPPDLEAFLQVLLEKEVVAAVLALRNLEDDSGKVSFSLVSKEADLSTLAPDFPAMPVNGGKVVSRFTLEGVSPNPVAVVLRPCEIRALIELVKLEQARLENLFIIGLECGGVYPFEEIVVKGDEAKLLAQYQDALRNGEIPPGIRPLCQGCDLFQPGNADIIVSMVGRERPQLAFVTDKGIELAEKASLSLQEGEIYTSASQSLLEKRKVRRQELIQGMKGQVKGFAGLIDVFGKCIGCHCCSHVCPLCYCKDCFFESATFDYEPISYFERVNKKRALRAPMDTVLFHLGRMTHMGTSCVACGACEDACPVGIPVAQVFKTIGADLQELFDYLPGRSLQEELPLTIYRLEEFTEVEE